MVIGKVGAWTGQSKTLGEEVAGRKLLSKAD